MYFFLVLLLVGEDLPAESVKLLEDDAEHRICFSYNDEAAKYRDMSIRSACKKDGSGRVEISSSAAFNGEFAYKIEIDADDLPYVDYDGALHLGKMTVSNRRLLEEQRLGNKLRYSAYYYIDNGFDAFGPAWNIQMQWKGYIAGRKGNDRYWLEQNPKIALGFHRIAKDSPLEVTITVREAKKDSCEKFSYDKYTRSNTLNLPAIPLPYKKWFQIIVEIYFSEVNGSIEIWQKNDDLKQQIIKVDRINTVTQLIEKEIAKDIDLPCNDNNKAGLHYTTPTHFNFGMGNYISGTSFMSSFRAHEGPHVLYIDNILVEDISN